MTKYTVNPYLCTPQMKKRLVLTKNGFKRESSDRVGRGDKSH